MVIEVVQKENERQRNIGMKKGMRQGRMEILKETVKNMLQFGETDDKIRKYVGISEKELDKIRKSL